MSAFPDAFAQLSFTLTTPMSFTPSLRRLAAFQPTVSRMARTRATSVPMHPKAVDPVSVAKAVAKTASTPHKLRIKAAKKAKRTLRPGEAAMDAAAGLMHGEENKLIRARLHRDDLAANLDNHQLLAELRQREYRIRGIVDGKIVGHKVWLPNYLVTMTRNHTLPGHPYNPFEATFRIPQSMTKIDMRGYLKAVYGLDVTYIRTDNYNGFNETRRNPRTGRMGVRERARYKRAVVGLHEPFYFPLMLEDMSTAEREARTKHYETVWNVNEYARAMWRQKTIQTHELDPDAEPETRREILNRIRARRELREKQIEASLKGIRRLREEKQKNASQSTS